MRSIVWFGCLSVWLVFPAFRPPKPLVSRHFRLERLADGVWSAINNTAQGGHAICNAGIVDLGDRTVVFDPFMNLDAATDLRRAAEQLTGRRATWVVNSHHHNDHIRGNQVFLPAAIVSTAWNRREISVTEPRQLQWERQHAAGILAMYRKQLGAARTTKQREDVLLWLGYFEGMVQSGPSIRTTLPDVLFSDSLWIHGSRRSLKLVEFRNGHTTSDVVLILPTEGIVFTGDLFFHDAHPHLADGNPDALVRHLGMLSGEASWKTFVPGHGPVGGREDLRQLAGYVRDLQELVREGKASGLSDSSIVAQPIPPAYADWTFGRRFFEDNVAFLCGRMAEGKR